MTDTLVTHHGEPALKTSLRRRCGPAILAAAALAGAACSSGPEPFDGTAIERVEEVIRRLDAKGIHHADADVLLDTYGDDGGSECDHENAEERREIDATARALFEPIPRGTEFQLIVLEVYCPHLI